MKNRKNILVPVLVIALVVASAAPAAAGLFGRDKDAPRELPTKWRFDKAPELDFASGKVTRDIYAGWQIGGTRLILKKDCVVVDADGQPTELSDGDEVVIMGPRAGNTYVAWQIHVLPTNLVAGLATEHDRIQWSEVDRTVGEGEGPN